METNGNSPSPHLEVTFQIFSMKTKSLIVIAILIIGILASCQDENEYLRSDAELIQALKADVEFQDFFREARSIRLTLTEKLMNLNSKEGLNNVRNSTNLEEVALHLGLGNNFFKELDDRSKNITDLLSIRYPEFNLKTQEELSSMVYASITFDYNSENLVHSNLRNAGVNDACDEQFEADFNRIHASYDSGIRTCLVVGLATAGAGLIPCNAANVYRTLVDLADAMDAHTLCKQK